MALNTKFNSDQAAEDGIAAGAATVVMLTSEITMVNAVPVVGVDGVTLKSANQNTIGDEFIVVNDSATVGPFGPVNIFPVAADTINGVAAPFVLGPVAPAPGSTVTFKCVGLGQWWIVAMI